MNKKGFCLYIIVILLVISYIYIIIKDNKNTVYESSVYKYEESSMNDNILAFSNSTSDIKENAFELVSINKKSANEVLNETNNYRKEIGNSDLVLDDKLSIVANYRAMEMALYDKFSHVRPNGSNYSELFNELGIDSYSSGENIAFGYINPEEVCVGWKESAGHYANMINSRYKKLGVGKYTYNGTTYWVQIFSN